MKDISVMLVCENTEEIIYIIQNFSPPALEFNN